MRFFAWILAYHFRQPIIHPPMNTQPVVCIANRCR